MVVSTVYTGARQVSRQVVVNAPAAEIFALVADPRRHPELDGSGTVRATPVKGPDRLTLGSSFSVGMKQYGVPYTITSKVVALEPDRLLAWRHPAGHTWRWQLDATTPNVTTVTETFDYSTSKAPKLMELTGQPGKNAAGITRTLEALAARFA